MIPFNTGHDKYAMLDFPDNRQDQVPHNDLPTVTPHLPPFLSKPVTMAPPSRLAIATSSLQRLVKEESSYHKELEQQQARLEKLEKDKDDENAEYLVTQQVRAAETSVGAFM